MALVLSAILFFVCLSRFAQAQTTCSVHAETFETDFCRVKKEIEVLKSDHTAILNSESEFARVWHTIQTATKSVYDNKKAIEGLQRDINNTAQNSGVDPTTLLTFTADFQSMITNLSSIITTLEDRVAKLEVKCATCSPGGHPCTFKPCQNGGKCVELGKDYYCACPVGFDGKDCDAEDHCLSSPCMNNGTCINNIIGYTCTCHKPYIGQNCSKEMGICDTIPCSHGLCVPDGKNFKCLCDPGFYGEYCNTNIDISKLTTKGSSKSTTMYKNITSTTATTPISTTAATTVPSANNVTAKSTMPPSSTVSQTTPPSHMTSIASHGSVATAHNPCSDSSLCNAPSQCVPKGVGYICECPESDKTRNSTCLEPYYMEMYAICCMQDTCKPGSDPIC